MIATSLSKSPAGEAGDYTITHASAIVTALIICVSGGETAFAPWNTFATGTGTTNTAQSTYAADSASYVAYIAHAWASYGSGTPPTGYTERLDAANSLIYAADKNVSSAGDTGAPSNGNPNAAGQPWGAWLVCIPPAGTMPSTSPLTRSITHKRYDAGAIVNTTIPAPYNIQNGDVLVLAFGLGGAAATPPTPTFPAGFTTLQSQNVTGSGSLQVTYYLAWKAASSESGSYLITHASARSAGVMLCVAQGDSGTTPTNSKNSGTGTTTTATEVTASALGWVGFLSCIFANYGASAPPAGTTPTFIERHDPNDSIIYAADGYGVGAGATGDKSHVQTNAGGAPWVGFLVAIAAGAVAPSAFPHHYYASLMR